MTPLAMFGLGVPELLIILAVVLLLFGGSRLAGLGKSTGRALKEFKEETKSLKGAEGQPGGSTPITGNPYEAGPAPQAQTGQPAQPGTVYGQVPPTGTSYHQPPSTGTPYDQAPQSESPYVQPPQDGTGIAGTPDTRRDV